MMTQAQHDWLITEGYQHKFDSRAQWWGWVQSEHDRGTARHTGVFVPMDDDGRQAGAPRMVTRQNGKIVEAHEFTEQRTP
jgi:hypothetical protein